MYQEPRHPGKIVVDLLKKYELKKTDLQEALLTTWKTVSDLVNCKHSIQLPMACKLSKFFPEYSTKDWLLFQIEYDIYRLSSKDPELLLKTESKLLTDLNDIVSVDDFKNNRSNNYDINAEVNQ